MITRVIRKYRIEHALLLDKSIQDDNIYYHRYKEYQRLLKDGFNQLQIAKLWGWKVRDIRQLILDDWND